MDENTASNITAIDRYCQVMPAIHVSLRAKLVNQHVELNKYSPTSPLVNNYIYNRQ